MDEYERKEKLQKQGRAFRVSVKYNKPQKKRSTPSPSNEAKKQCVVIKGTTLGTPIEEEKPEAPPIVVRSFNCFNREANLQPERQHHSHPIKTQRVHLKPKQGTPLCLKRKDQEQFELIGHPPPGKIALQTLQKEVALILRGSKEATQDDDPLL